VLLRPSANTPPVRRVESTLQPNATLTCAGYEYAVICEKGKH